MKKLIVSLLTLSILLSSCLVVSAAGFRDEYGFTYEADSHGNLSVTGFDGTEMDVMPAYSAYPVVKIKNLAFMNNTTLLQDVRRLVQSAFHGVFQMYQLPHLRAAPL